MAILGLSKGLNFYPAAMKFTIQVEGVMDNINMQSGSKIQTNKYKVVMYKKLTLYKKNQTMWFTQTQSVLKCQASAMNSC